MIYFSVTNEMLDSKESKIFATMFASNRIGTYIPLAA